MKRWIIIFGCWIAAFAATLGLVLLAAAHDLKPVLYGLSISWALYDSKRVALWRYDTGLAGRPPVLMALFLALGWPFVFPWYLATRLTILTGTARLRDEFKQWRMSDQTVAPNGLIQPWRGKSVE